MRNSRSAYNGGIVLKSDIINKAYSDLKISGLTTNPTPGEVQLALVELESMAGEFRIRNMDANYNFEDEPDTATVSNIPRSYLNAYAAMLAARLAANFGKTLTPELMAKSNAGCSLLSSGEAQVNPVGYPSRQARGSGNTFRQYRWRRYYSISNPAPAEDTTNRMVADDIDNFVEHFDSYLDANEVISSFTINADQGLVINSSSNTDRDVNYNIKADGSRQGSLRVKIVITTDAGRVETRLVYFDVTKIEGLD